MWACPHGSAGFPGSHREPSPHTPLALMPNAIGRPDYSPPQKAITATPLPSPAACTRPTPTARPLDTAGAGPTQARLPHAGHERRPRRSFARAPHGRRPHPQVRPPAASRRHAVASLQLATAKTTLPKRRRKADEKKTEPTLPRRLIAPRARFPLFPSRAADNARIRLLNIDWRGSKAVVELMSGSLERIGASKPTDDQAPRSDNRDRIFMVRLAPHCRGRALFFPPALCLRPSSPLVPPSPTCARRLPPD